MITSQDINKIIDAFRDLFYTKEEMDEKFTTLQTAVDGISKGVKILKEESVVMNYRMGNVEKRLDHIEGRLGGVEDRLGITDYK